VPLDPPTGTIAGGHALLVTGYRTDPATGSIIFDICNSWSDAFGNGGYCEMTEAYMTWGQTDDLWIVEVVPDFAAA
jgi:C1A family cysteine protease